MVAAVSIHLLHGYQVQRNKGAFLTMARKSEASLEDMVQQKSATLSEMRDTAKQSVTFYRRYLGLAPDDLEVRMEYAKFLLKLGDYQSAYGQNERILRETVAGAPELLEKQTEIREIQIQLAGQFKEFSDGIYHINQLLEDQLPETDAEERAKWLAMRGQYQLQLQATSANSEAARDSFEAAIEESPDYLPAYTLLAQVLRTRFENPMARVDGQQIPEAEQIMNQMVEANPDNPAAYLRRAHFKQSDNSPAAQEKVIRRRMVEDAVADCQQALELESDYVPALALLSDCKQQLSNLLDTSEERAAAQQEAIALIKQVIALSGDSPSPNLYEQWANLELDAGDRNAGTSAEQRVAAIEALRQGIAAVAPAKSFPLRCRLAELLLFDESTRAEAEQMIAQLKQDAPQAALVTYLQARQLMAQRQWAEAANLLENNREGIQQHSEMLLNRVDMLLGQCYAELGAYQDKYLQAAQRAVERDPLDVDARINLARALTSVNRLSRAIDQYEAVLRMGTPSPQTYKQYAELLLRYTLRQRPDRRDWDAVSNVVDKIGAQLPENDSWATLMRVNVLLNTDQLDTAEEILTNARQENPNQLQYWRALVNLAKLEGDDAKARQRFQDLREKFGDTMSVRVLHAQLIANEEPEDALDQLAQLATDLDDFSEFEQTQIYWQLARSCLALQAYNQGLQYAQQAAEFIPNNVRLSLFMLQMARVAGNVEAAQQLAAEIKDMERGSQQIANTDKEDTEADKEQEHDKPQLGPVTLYAQASVDVTRYQAAVSAAANVAKDDEQAQNLIQKAKRDNKGFLASAQNKLRQAAQQRSTWSTIPVMQGRIAELQTEVDETVSRTDVINFYRRAIDLGDSDPQIAYKVVQALGQEAAEGGSDSEEKWREADAIIRKLQDQESALPRELSLLASRVNYSREDYDRAFDLARPLARSSELEHQLWVGQVSMALGRYAEARTHLEQAVNTSPQNPVTWISLVRCLLLADERDAAEKTVQEAIEKVDPKARVVLRAECLRMMGELQEAVKLVREQISAADASPELLERAARFLANVPFAHDDAIPILERFVSGDLKTGENAGDTRRWARRELARILGQRDYKSFQRAMELLAQNLSENPDSITDRRLRVKLLASSARTKTQREHYVKDLLYLAEEPSRLDPECRFLLAQYHLKHGNWRAYNQQMIQVLTSSDGNPRQPTYMQAYIQALLEHDDTSEAQGIASTLHRKWPDQLGSSLLLARTLLAGVRPKAEEALEVIQNAVNDPEVKPDDKTAKLLQSAGALQSIAMELETRVADLAATEEPQADGRDSDSTPDSEAGSEPLITEDAPLTDTADTLLDTDDPVAGLNETAADRASPEARRKRLEQQVESIRAAASNYLEVVAEQDPARQLARVPFLINQGQQPLAVELIKQHWESAEPRVLARACQAVLPDLKTLDREKIQEILTQAIEQHSGTDDALPLLHQLASHYTNRGVYDKAIELYQTIVERSENDYLALNNLSALMAYTGKDLPTALEYINRAAEMVGPVPLIIDSRATVLLASNKPKEALDAMQQVIAEKPETLNKEENPEEAKRWGAYHFHLALAYQKNNQKEKAAQHMQQARKLGLAEDDLFAPELNAYRDLLEFIDS